MKQGCPLNLLRERDFENLFFESGKENLFSKSLIKKEKIDSLLKISIPNRENIFYIQNLFSKSRKEILDSNSILGKEKIFSLENQKSLKNFKNFKPGE